MRVIQGLFAGAIIGVLGTMLINNMNINYPQDNETRGYASSFLYRNTAPTMSGEYYIETPILKALVDDIEWNIVEESDCLFYEGVFDNWTDVDINKVILELSLSSKDDVILNTNSFFIYDLPSKSKMRVRIKLPYEYDVKKLKNIKINVKGKSRDFKNKEYFRVNQNG